MARIVEDSYQWTLTGSTGSFGGKAYKVGPEAGAFSFYFAGTFGSSATGSTAAVATVQVQAAFGSSAGPWISMGAASTLSHANSVTLHQFTGPLEWVRPYCSSLSASTETITCRLYAN
jgi:hypothetical protein